MSTFHVSPSGQGDFATINEALNLSKKAAGPHSILLHRGETHAGFNVQPGDTGRLNGLTIGAYGEGAIPRITGKAYFSRDPINELTLGDFVVQGTLDPADPSKQDGGIFITKGNGVLIERVMVIEGDEGIHLTYCRNVVLRSVVSALNQKSGALIGHTAGVAIEDSAFVLNGWHPVTNPRTENRHHGLYFNQETTGVTIDRSILALNEQFGWKAERGGVIRDSLLVGNAIHLQLGSGAGFAGYVAADNPFTSERNVYAAAMQTAMSPAARVTMTHEPGIGHTIFRDDLIGPPVTADGKPREGAFRGTFVRLETPGTRIIGYDDSPTSTVTPILDSHDVWEARVRGWLASDIFPDVAMESEFVRSRLIDEHGPATDIPPPVVVDPTPTPEPVEEPLPDPVTPQAPTVEYTAEGGGLIEVTVNGVLRSRHTAEREAYESATNAALADPAATVRVMIQQTVRVEVRQ